MDITGRSYMLITPESYKVNHLSMHTLSMICVPFSKRHVYGKGVLLILSFVHEIIKRVKKNTFSRS